MQNYTLRIRIYDPVDGYVYIPGMGRYHEEDFKCDVEQIFKSETENEIIFSVSMPSYYVVRLKDPYREPQPQTHNNDCIEEDEEDEEEPNVVDEFGDQLDILSHEVKDFRSDIRDAIDLLADDLEDIKPDREQLEKLKKIRADLEKLNLEFGEIL